MSQKRYTKEFKAEAVKQVTERCYSVLEVAQRLGVSDKSLYVWLKTMHSASGNQVTPELNEIRLENVRLKAALKRAEEERDILKKAAAYFAKVSG